MGDLELNTLYETIKREKEKKKISITQTENIFQYTNSLKPTIISLGESPIKKNTPNSSLNNNLKRVK